MPNESSVKDKQPGEGDPLTFFLLKTETESKFIFVLKCKIIAPYQFALMKFPLFHLLKCTITCFHSRYILGHIFHTTRKASVHNTAVKIAINYNKVNISLSFLFWYQIHTKTPLER